MIINIPLKKLLLISLLFLVFLSVIFLLDHVWKAFGEGQEDPNNYITIEQVPTARFGYEARNPDGTYYPGDPLTFTWSLHGLPPVLKGDTPVLVSNIESDYSVISRGSNFVVINSTATLPYGDHHTTVSVILKSGKTNIEVFRLSKTFTHTLVPYRPVFSTYAYTALNDFKRYPYEDRTGVVMNFQGSRGNNLSDNFIYSGRRLMLYDNNSTSISTGLEVNMGKFGGYPFPTGFEEKPSFNVIDIHRESKSKFGTDKLIYMPQAGHEKFYYITTPRNQTIIDNARTLNMIISYIWPEGNFGQNVTYSMPQPHTPVTNMFNVTVLPSNMPFNVTIESQPQFKTIRNYAYEQALNATKDVQTAELVKSDMPENHYSVINQYHYTEIPITRLNYVTLKDAEGNETEFKGILDNTLSPIDVTVNLGNGNKTFTESYPNYTFQEDIVTLPIDVRQNIPLKSIGRQIGGQDVSVTADWPIARVIAKDTSVYACGSGNSCTLITNSDQATPITVYNKYGGSAMGIIPAIKQGYNPLNSQVIDNFKWLLLVFAVGAIIVFAARKLIVTLFS